MLEKRVLRSPLLTLTFVVAALAATPGMPAAESLTFVAKKKTTPRERKLAKVRQDLHRNLDGKGNGFITGWTFDAKRFTLTVDQRRYQQHMLYAATITARSIFDINGVALPKTLVIRDVSGEILGEGPFANVPKIVE